MHQMHMQYLLGQATVIPSFQPQVVPGCPWLVRYMGVCEYVGPSPQ